MRDIVFGHFSRMTTETVTDQVSSTWEEFVEMIRGDHPTYLSKRDGQLFNGIEFLSRAEATSKQSDKSLTKGSRVRRIRECVKSSHLLVLDFDHGVPIPEVQDRYKDVEYIGYTSWSHQTQAVDDRFRLVFPLITPIPLQDDLELYFSLLSALKDFGQGCDLKALGNVAQMYFLPCQPSTKAIRPFAFWHNKGKWLDWATFKQQEVADVPTKTVRSALGNVPQSKGRTWKPLDSDTQFVTGKGATVIAREIPAGSRIQNVLCPFHSDKTPTEFIVNDGAHGVLFVCKTCGLFRLPIQELGGAASSTTTVVAKPRVDPSDRSRVSKILDQVKADVLNEKTSVKKRAARVIYLPEGSGKSHLALELALMSRGEVPKTVINPSLRQQILNEVELPSMSHGSTVWPRRDLVFACKSWKQARAKYEEFKPELDSNGCVAVLATSTQEKVERRFQVKVVRGPALPFRTGEIDLELTIKGIVRKHPNVSEQLIRVSLAIFRDESARLESAIAHAVYRSNQTACQDSDPLIDQSVKSSGQSGNVVVFTTFARLRLVGAADHLPEGAIVWIDDPDVSDLIDIERIDSRKKPSKQVATTTINNVTYAERPQENSLGANLTQFARIYTTTEKLTLRFLEHQFQQKHRSEKYQIYGDREHLSGSRITILGSKAVGKRLDAIFPLIARAALTKSFDCALIANGIPAEFNHTTNKGRNDLTDRNILVELSIPHPQQVETICSALGLNFVQHQREIQQDLLLDQLHQALGRNSGYRFRGKECVVVVPHTHHAYIKANCAYEIDDASSVIIDLPAKNKKVKSNLPSSASEFVKAVERGIVAFGSLLYDLRTLKPAFKYVLNAVGDDDLKKSMYVSRLLVALSEYSKFEFFDPSSPPPNKQIKMYDDFAIWVVQQLPTQYQNKAISQYQSDRL